jgi:hypothetical protein
MQLGINTIGLYGSKCDAPWRSGFEMLVSQEFEE